MSGAAPASAHAMLVAAFPWALLCAAAAFSRCGFVLASATFATNLLIVFIVGDAVVNSSLSMGVAAGAIVLAYAHNSVESLERKHARLTRDLEALLQRVDALEGAK